MEDKVFICKYRSDPTLTVGDYVMDRGTPRRVEYIKRFEKGGSTVILEPMIYPKEQLQKEQRDACQAVIMDYIMGVRSGTKQPTEAGEAFLFKHLPGKYLGNGRFAGVDDRKGLDGEVSGKGGS